MAEILLIQLLEQRNVVSGVFLKVSTLLALVANAALVFKVVVVFTREVVLEVAEAVLARQHLDWHFRQVTKKRKLKGNQE